MFFFVHTWWLFWLVRFVFSFFLFVPWKNEQHNDLLSLWFKPSLSMEFKICANIYPTNDELIWRTNFSMSHYSVGIFSTWFWMAFLHVCLFIVFAETELFFYFDYGWWYLLQWCCCNRWFYGKYYCQYHNWSDGALVSVRPLFRSLHTE